MDGPRHRAGDLLALFRHARAFKEVVRLKDFRTRDFRYGLFSHDPWHQS